MKCMAPFRKSSLLLGVSLLACSFCDSAWAISRTVYFVTSGINRTQVGMSSSAQSYCRLTINNPSSVTETVAITSSVQSIDAWTGSTGSYVTGVLDTTAPTGGASVGACTVSSCSATLPRNSTVTINYKFTAYPDHTQATASSQSLRCSGSIQASDSTGTPGFLIASGVLMTFTESSQMHTDASTAGTGPTFGGIPIYSQVPLVVNRGKPF